MTKLEIIDYLAKKSDVKKKDITFIVDRFLGEIKKSVNDGEKVEIRGFGTFHPEIKKARKVHSPIANKIVDVPQKQTLGFKPSKSTEKKI